MTGNEARADFDIWFVDREGRDWGEPPHLDGPINTESSEIDVYVDPEERYLIYVSYRDAGQGRGDLYISYNRDGTWTPAENLGSTVNTAAREYCPFVSPDGRYLFLRASVRLPTRRLSGLLRMRN